jgi:hypothetical protein
LAQPDLDVVYHRRGVEHVALPPKVIRQLLLSSTK